jgi:hypothetical protein
MLMNSATPLKDSVCQTGLKRKLDDLFTRNLPYREKQTLSWGKSREEDLPR